MQPADESIAVWGKRAPEQRVDDLEYFESNCVVVVSCSRLDIKIVDTQDWCYVSDMLKSEISVLYCVVLPDIDVDVN